MYGNQHWCAAETYLVEDKEQILAVVHMVLKDTHQLKQQRGK